MRHKHGYRKLARNTPHRQAMLRNLACALLTYGRIVTTEARAKETRRLVEKLITYAKKAHAAEQKNDKKTRLHYYNLAQRYVKNDALLKKLFGDIKNRFLTRQGGYTRILRLGGFRWKWDEKGGGRGKVAYNRLGDQAQKVFLELTERKEKDEEEYLACTGKRFEKERAAKRATMTEKEKNK